MVLEERRLWCWFPLSGKGWENQSLRVSILPGHTGKLTDCSGLPRQATYIGAFPDWEEPVASHTSPIRELRPGDNAKSRMRACDYYAPTDEDLALAKRLRPSDETGNPQWKLIEADLVWRGHERRSLAGVDALNLLRMLDASSRDATATDSGSQSALVRTEESGAKTKGSDPDVAAFVTLVEEAIARSDEPPSRTNIHSELPSYCYRALAGLSHSIRYASWKAGFPVPFAFFGRNDGVLWLRDPFAGGATYGLHNRDTSLQADLVRCLKSWLRRMEQPKPKGIARLAVAIDDCRKLIEYLNAARDFERNAVDSLGRLALDLQELVRQAKVIGSECLPLPLVAKVFWPRPPNVSKLMGPQCQHEYWEDGPLRLATDFQKTRLDGQTDGDASRDEVAPIIEAATDWLDRMQTQLASESTKTELPSRTEMRVDTHALQGENNDYQYDGKWLTAAVCKERFNLDDSSLGRWANEVCPYLAGNKLRRKKFPPEEKRYCYCRPDIIAISEAIAAKNEE